MKVPKIKIITELVEVKVCQDCPYYYTLQDMSAHIPCCQLKKGGVPYSEVINDYPWEVIDKNCPLKGE